MNKQRFKFELKDRIRKIGEREVRTIEAAAQMRDGETKYWIQVSNDPASCVWAKESELELVAKAEKPQGGPGLLPGHSLME
jgi:hypothetical protein